MASRMTSIGTGSRLSVPSDDSNVLGITREDFLNDTVVSIETSNGELRPAEDNSDGERGSPSVTSNMVTAMGPFSSHFPTVERARNILRDFESDTVATVSRSPSISASSTADGNNEQFSSDVVDFPMVIRATSGVEENAVQMMENMDIQGVNDIEFNDVDQHDGIIGERAPEVMPIPVVEDQPLSPNPSPPVCLICRGYMFAPVYSCRDGHNLCQFCHKRLPRCPWCNLPREEIRNRYIEDQAGTVRVPCKYRENGCNMSILPSGYNAHVSTCFYDPEIVDVSSV